MVVAVGYMSMQGKHSFLLDIHHTCIQHKEDNTQKHSHLPPSSSVMAAKKMLVMRGAISTWSSATLENTASGEVGSEGDTYCCCCVVLCCVLCVFGWVWAM